MIMEALNRAFEKAFAHTDQENDIDDLLTCMGEEMECKRISIFEENEEGTCDNTYEWCRPGVVHEQILLQHVEIAKFDTWHDRLIHRESIIVHDPEELREHDPDVYKMFIEQGIHTAIVMLLAFHGKNFGFCILEDPAKAVMADHKLIIPGMRYILSSMIYSRNLASRLRRLGYTDTLTGAGNRVSMQEHLEHLDLTKSVGVITVDVVGWDDDEGKMPRLEREQTLLRTGDLLLNIYDEEHVFRVTTGEFVIIDSGVERGSFDTNLKTIRGLLREHNLLASVAGEWRGSITGGHGEVDELIRAMHRRADADKKKLVSHRADTRHRHAEETETYEKANISMPRGDEFFRIADLFLADLYEGSVVTILTDINYFKLYNDIFGRKAGNVFLENIARTVQEVTDEYRGVCGYIGGDNFCAIVPTEKKELQQIIQAVERFYAELRFPDGFAPAIGVYFTDDHRETMITLYDHAQTALSEIKGDYIRHINYYSAEMHRHQKEDKLLLMNVKEGLENGEFVFYVQPQVNERTGKIIGGEALVRWLHEGQLISPGRFIPILEKTGYIYAVDSYIWESVAAWQRSLIDRGIKPVPISVNVSRVDFYFADIAGFFIELIQKYDLDPELIGIEITESAFTDNMETILDAIRGLHEAGFHILMDDFGSGSSSLSMLHTMNVDVLKTDVQFMSRSEQDNRAISIVESVISMAHMIGMSVVTEGVETAEQRDSLIELGDNFAQGFYFYRPMPKKEFEELIKDPANIAEGYKAANKGNINQLSFRDMIREGLVSESLLSNIIRAAAIYRVDPEGIVILQMNDLYSELTGIEPVEEEMTAFAQRLDESSLAELERMFREAGSHELGGSEGVVRFRKGAGGDEFVELSMRVFQLYAFDSHVLYLSTMG